MHFQTLLQTFCLLLVFETSVTTAQRKKLSTPEECARPCTDDGEPLTCYYKFAIEYYTTMGRACELCKPNNTNQIVSECKCVQADGFERGILAVNRMLPGPSIQVCVKDTVIVDIENKIEGMEVTVHWHGIFQQGYQYYDGVPFLTQCPIHASKTFRYQFVANNKGTHFWHSHTGVQKIDGIYGSLIVRQPRSADPHSSLYDHDLPTHVILLSDWTHEMSIERFPGRLKSNIGQVPENVLINGKGRWMDPATNQTTSVQLETFSVQPGKRYRFRMINSFGSICPAQLTIEGHSITLIAQDGEPVQPVPINTIISFSGERVDFIVKADQPVGAYWIQLRGLGECDRNKVNQLGILRYGGGPAEPRTSKPAYKIGLRRGIEYNPLDAKCDVPQSNAVCVSQLKSVEPVSAEILQPQPDHRIVLPFYFYEFNNTRLFQSETDPRFLVASDRAHITSLVDGISGTFPRVPPLSQNITSSDTCNQNDLPKDCGTPCECPHTHHIKKGAVVEVVIYDELAQPMLSHPFHLHGYSFSILKMGRFANITNISRSDIDKVIYENEMSLKSALNKDPPSKDTIAVPHRGYVIIRFKADNPGWWLFHCHFIYHISIGMQVIFHVGEREDLPPVPPGFPTCDNFTPKIGNWESGNEIAEDR